MNGNPRQPILSVDGISKKFRRDKRHTLRYFIADCITACAKLSTPPHTPALRNGEFWAVDNLSLSLFKGDVCGMIGKNGSGKTTALRMIAGNLRPDTGCISTRGTAKTLLMPATSLCHNAPVRVKMKFLATLYGLPSASFRDRFDAMVRFSGLGNSLDKPCTSLSLGMHSRLIFSVFMALNASLYIIDEALTATDEEYRQRAVDAIKTKAQSGAVIFVSHNLDLIQRVCTRICILDKGSIAYSSGCVRDGIEAYGVMVRSKTEGVG
ncbi:MAG: ATP-binding cassette domain-containing protein [Chitinivibrionales bacterium]|nr:ATP-binding cassette domain-containing protein [Chitinivibrionales bacterium]